jgi:hypothetical protein
VIELVLEDLNFLFELLLDVFRHTSMCGLRGLRSPKASSNYTRMRLTSVPIVPWVTAGMTHSSENRVN